MRWTSLVLLAACLAAPARAEDAPKAKCGTDSCCSDGGGCCGETKPSACDELAASCRALAAAEKRFRAYGILERAKLEGLVRTIPAMQTGSRSMATSYGAVAAALEAAVAGRRAETEAPTDADALKQIDALGATYRALERTLLARLDAPAPKADAAVDVAKALDLAKQALIAAETELGSMTPVAQQRGREAVERLRAELPKFDEEIGAARTLAGKMLDKLAKADTALAPAYEIARRADALAARLAEAPPKPVLQVPT